MSPPTSNKLRSQTNVTTSCHDMKHKNGRTHTASDDPRDLRPRMTPPISTRPTMRTAATIVSRDSTARERQSPPRRCRRFIPRTTPATSAVVATTSARSRAIENANPKYVGKSSPHMASRPADRAMCPPRYPRTETATRLTMTSAQLAGMPTNPTAHANSG